MNSHMMDINNTLYTRQDYPNNEFVVINKWQ